MNRTQDLKDWKNWGKFGCFLNDCASVIESRRMTEAVSWAMSWAKESRQGVSFEEWVGTHPRLAEQALSSYAQYLGVELAEAEAPNMADELGDMCYELAKVWPMNSFQVGNSLSAYDISEEHRKEFAAQYAAEGSKPYLGSWSDSELKALLSWVGYQTKKAVKQLKLQNGEQDRNTTVIGQPKPVGESMPRERKLIRELGSITEETERNTQVARLIEARLRGER